MEILGYVLGAIVAVGSILLGVKWKEMRPWARRLLIICILCVVVGLIISIVIHTQKVREEREAALVQEQNNVNKLVADKEKAKADEVKARTDSIVAAEKRAEELSAKEKAALIERIERSYGDLEDVHDSSEPFINPGSIQGRPGLILKGKGAIVIDGDEPMFRINIVNGKLRVSMVIREPSGKAVAVIENNTWTVFGDDYEYNDDETAFEMVTRGERKIFFQIELKSGKVNLVGFLWGKNGRGFYFGSSARGNHFDVIHAKSDYPTSHFVDKVLFKYPREKHYGQRARLSDIGP